MVKRRSSISLAALVAIATTMATLVFVQNSSATVNASPTPSAATGPVEQGNVVSTLVWSPSLNRHVHVLIYLPPGYSPTKGPYPVLYLLHGFPGTAPSLFAGLDLAPTLNRLIHRGDFPPAIVVAPSDGPTSETDTEWEDSVVDPTMRWGTFVSQDLVSWMDQRYATCTERSGRAIGGYSMGAFGAMNLALKNLDEYGTALLWSPYFLSNTPTVDGLEGSPSADADSPLDYVSSLVGDLAEEPLRISFYSTKADGFYHQVVDFADVLQSDNVPFEFTTYPGRHNMILWRTHLASQLIWLGKSFAC